MLFTSRVAGRSCRRRGLGAGVGRSRRYRSINACRLHPVMLASAAAGEASARALGIHGCWQELLSARPQCMPHAGTVVGRCCRRRGTSACPLHPVWLAAVAAGEASAHSARMQGGGQGPPPARKQRMPLAAKFAGRSGQRHGFGAFRLLPSRLAGAAAGEASAHAACMQGCWQERPPSSAAIVAGRSGQRHDLGACRLRALLVAGEAAGCEAPSDDACGQCC